jgi:hypothetical protein
VDGSGVEDRLGLPEIEEMCSDNISTSFVACIACVAAIVICFSVRSCDWRRHDYVLMDADQA